MPPRKTDNAENFPGVEWFGEYVVRPDVEDFCPKAVVCKLGGHDEIGRIRTALARREQILPITVGKSFFAQNYGGRLIG